MGVEFLNAYKRLDNLCRDMNGAGVTGYIEDMRRSPNGAYTVPGWANDYRMLRHYRHIRNRIVHENGADERDLCSADDVAWIERFHQRILTQSDPLALCSRAAQPRPVPRRPAPAAFRDDRYIPSGPRVFKGVVWILLALCGCMMLLLTAAVLFARLLF